MASGWWSGTCDQRIRPRSTRSGCTGIQLAERSSQPKDLGGASDAVLVSGSAIMAQAAGAMTDCCVSVPMAGFTSQWCRKPGHLLVRCDLSRCRRGSANPWERCEIVRGRSDRYLPHSSGQGGSNTIFTHTRTNWVAAQDAIAKMKEIAAMDLGGTADDYEIGDERVFKTADNSQGLTLCRSRPASHGTGR